MKSARNILDKYVTKVEGASNTMPKPIEVMNKKDAETLDMKDIFARISSAEGLHVRRSGYNALKDRFRDLTLENHMIEKDAETGYYSISEWRNDEVDLAVRVNYRVRLYTNSRGFDVNGNHLTIAA